MCGCLCSDGEGRRGERRGKDIIYMCAWVYMYVCVCCGGWGIYIALGRVSVGWRGGVSSSPPSLLYLPLSCPLTSPSQHCSYPPLTLYVWTYMWLFAGMCGYIQYVCMYVGEGGIYNPNSTLTKIEPNVYGGIYSIYGCVYIYGMWWGGTHIYYIL